LVVSKAAFIADSDEGRGANVGVADWAFAVTLVAETSDSSACLLAAHNEIAEVYQCAVDMEEGSWEKRLTDDGETWRGFRGSFVARSVQIRILSYLRRSRSHLRVCGRDL
jgi:hypothetical protein